MTSFFQINPAPVYLHFWNKYLEYLKYLRNSHFSNISISRYTPWKGTNLVSPFLPKLSFHFCPALALLCLKTTRSGEQAAGRIYHTGCTTHWMYHTGYTTLLHPLDNQHRLDFLFDLPAVFLLGQEKWSEPQPLVGRQVTNLWNQYFEAMF